MTHKITKYTIIVGACLAVVYPLWVRMSTLTWDSGADLSSILFPFFGLTAASLLWLHAISGAFEPWLRANFNFDRFVQLTAGAILVCLIAHPLLLLISLGFKIWDLWAIYDITYIYIGATAWLLLISYDIIKPFKRQGFFARHWQKVLLISNIGFLLPFLHSLALGTDLQTGPLRAIWIFYGITATLAIVYTYGIRPILK